MTDLGDSNQPRPGCDDPTNDRCDPPPKPDKCEYPASIDAPPVPEPIDAGDQRLSAVGVLWRQNGANREAFCTGSLIGAKTVLTAYHCVQEYNKNPEDIWFDLGSDPIKVATAVDDPSRPVRGGFNDVGSDVAVMVLANDVDGVIPLDVRGLREDNINVGDSLTAVGYFFQRNGANDDGLHPQIADLALRDLAGQFFKDAFETPENFETCWAAYGNGDGAASLHSSSGELRRSPWHLAETGPSGDVESPKNPYEAELLDGYQAWFDGGPNGPQPCKGDSGGPLVGRTDDGLAVYGVVSGSVNLGDSKNTCAFGAVYAIFPKETLKWLQGVSALPE